MHGKQEQSDNKVVITEFLISSFKHISSVEHLKRIRLSGKFSITALKHQHDFQSYVTEINEDISDIELFSARVSRRLRCDP